MGSPKALLDYRGESFVARLARIHALFCDPVVVVLGFNADLVRPAVPSSARIALNPDPSRGMLSSLQCGLAACGAVDSVLFTPVDYPAVAESTVALLASAAPGAIAIPRFHGKRGHPVRGSAAVRDELLALPAGESAQTAIRARAADHIYIDVDDPGVTFDVDDPAAFAALANLGAAARC